jgi:hypothetical protein
MRSEAINTSQTVEDSLDQVNNPAQAAEAARRVLRRTQTGTPPQNLDNAANPA